MRLAQVVGWGGSRIKWHKWLRRQAKLHGCYCRSDACTCLGTLWRCQDQGGCVAARVCVCARARACASMSLGIARHARAPLASLGPRMIVVRDRCIYVLCVRETALLKAAKRREKKKDEGFLHKPKEDAVGFAPASLLPVAATLSCSAARCGAESECKYKEVVWEAEGYVCKFVEI